MGRRRRENCEEKSTFFGLGNCCCDFSTLIILILIILQFNRRREREFTTPIISEDPDCGTSKTHSIPILGSTSLIDNSILFIIALFFLSCCNPCRE